MGIYDKFQVAMIAILVKFENISQAIKKSARKCAASSEFLFCVLKLLLFYVFILVISVMVA